MDAVVDVVVEDHTVDMGVDADIVINVQEENTATRTGTAPTPAHNVKLPAQNISLQQHSQT